jgi:hypothetical protein
MYRRASTKPLFLLADYLIVPVVALILGGSNLLGYFKCSKEAKNQLQNTSLMTSAFTSSVNVCPTSLGLILVQLAHCSDVLLLSRKEQHTLGHDLL